MKLLYSTALAYFLACTSSTALHPIKDGIKLRHAGVHKPLQPQHSLHQNIPVSTEKLISSHSRIEQMFNNPHYIQAHNFLQEAWESDRKLERGAPLLYIQAVDHMAALCYEVSDTERLLELRKEMLKAINRSIAIIEPQIRFNIAGDTAILKERLASLQTRRINVLLAAPISYLPNNAPVDLKLPASPLDRDEPLKDYGCEMPDNLDDIPS